LATTFDLFSFACHGIAINFCTSTSLIDVTVYCAPGFGLAEVYKSYLLFFLKLTSWQWAGEGGLTLDNFQLIPGPTVKYYFKFCLFVVFFFISSISSRMQPANATVPRLQTSSWDGIEHTSVKKGPWVNHITVEFAGDDTWSAVSDAWQIARINAKKTWFFPSSLISLTCEEIDSTNKQITFNGGAPYSLFAGDSIRLRNELQYPNEEVIVVKVDMASYSLPLHAAYCEKCAAKALRSEFILFNFNF
jgi:hypothetical protein